MLMLLVPIFDHDDSWHALHAALSIARRFNGHVDALLVRQGMLGALGADAESAAFMHERLEHWEKETVRRATKARQTFFKIIDQHGIAHRDVPAGEDQPSASWQDFNGSGPTAVQRCGGVYDVIVFARDTGNHGGDWRSSMEIALAGTGRPVLLVPENAPRTIGDKIVIGWNRSAQSARALLGAMPFLRSAKEIVVLSIVTGAKEGPSPEKAARYLAWYGITAEVVELAPGLDVVGALLLAKTQELQADLLVMGAYSQSRLRKLILGGVTRHVIQHAGLPVLMAH